MGSENIVGSADYIEALRLNVLLLRHFYGLRPHFLFLLRYCNPCQRVGPHGVLWLADAICWLLCDFYAFIKPHAAAHFFHGYYIVFIFVFKYTLKMQQILRPIHY